MVTESEIPYNEVATINDLLNLFFLILFIFTLLVLPNMDGYIQEQSRRRFNRNGFG